VTAYILHCNIAIIHDAAIESPIIDITNNEPVIIFNVFFITFIFLVQSIYE